MCVIEVMDHDIASVGSLWRYASSLLVFKWYDMLAVWCYWKLSGIWLQMTTVTKLIPCPVCAVTIDDSKSVVRNVWSSSSYV